MNKMEENTPEVLINFRRKNVGRRNFIFLTSYTKCVGFRLETFFAVHVLL